MFSKVGAACARDAVSLSRLVRSSQMADECGGILLKVGAGVVKAVLAGEEGILFPIGLVTLDGDAGNQNNVSHFIGVWGNWGGGRWGLQGLGSPVNDGLIGVYGSEA